MKQEVDNRFLNNMPINELRFREQKVREIEESNRQKLREEEIEESNRQKLREENENLNENLNKPD